MGAYSDFGIRISSGIGIRFGIGIGIGIGSGIRMSEVFKSEIPESLRELIDYKYMWIILGYRHNPTTLTSDVLYGAHPRLRSDSDYC